MDPSYWERADLIRKKVAGTILPSERERLDYLQRKTLAALEAKFPQGDDGGKDHNPVSASRTSTDLHDGDDSTRQ
jgi:hypothetical protein